MPNFFNTLQWKIGVLTLVIACGFAGGWVRSFIVSDNLHCPITEITSIGVLSMDSHIGLGYTKSKSKFDRTGSLGWDRYPFSKMDTWAEPHFVWIWSACGFGLLSDRPTSGVYLKTLFVPYWSVVIPLTLLSSWLLLGRPKRARTVPSAAEYSR